MTRSVADIDREWDEVLRELRRRRRVKQTAPESWQRAWNLEPGLKERATALSLERYHAVREAMS